MFIYIAFLFLILFLLVLVRFLSKNNDPFGDLQVPKSNSTLQTLQKEGRYENSSMD